MVRLEVPGAGADGDALSVRDARPGRASRRRLGAADVRRSRAGTDRWGILFGLGVLFLLRAVALLVGVPIASQPTTIADAGTAVADVLMTPAWIAVGLLLWRRHRIGYSVALALLCRASMLFLGLIAFLLLRPVLTAAPPAPEAVVVVAVLAVPCLVAFTLFLRASLTSTGRRAPRKLPAP